LDFSIPFSKKRHRSFHFWWTKESYREKDKESGRSYGWPQLKLTKCL